MLAELDDRLLVGHLALVLDAVRDQVDGDDLLVGLHVLFHALALVVADNAVANQVGHEEHDHLLQIRCDCPVSGQPLMVSHEFRLYLELQTYCTCVRFPL